MFKSYITCNNDCVLSSVFLHLTIPLTVALLIGVVASLLKSKMVAFKYIVFALIIWLVCVALLYYLMKWSCSKQYKTLTYLIFILILCFPAYAGYKYVDIADALYTMKA